MKKAVLWIARVLSLILFFAFCKHRFYELGEPVQIGSYGPLHVIFIACALIAMHALISYVFTKNDVTMNRNYFIHQCGVFFVVVFIRLFTLLYHFIEPIPTAIYYIVKDAMLTIVLFHAGLQGLFILADKKWRFSHENSDKRVNSGAGK